ncbi:MAG TPA: TonB-dependent receptor [Verrucomicrobiae bacterium]|nr:TonB-dependent receptor [Verrucomicrobiae bacterium]
MPRFSRPLQTVAVALAALALLALLSAPCALAQSPRSIVVEGRVLDSSGAAVAGARVELHCCRSYSEAVLTTPDGHFSFAAVPGRFLSATDATVTGSVIVTASGFERAERSWTSSGAAPVELDIQLAVVSSSQRVVVSAALTPTDIGETPVSVVQLTQTDLQSTPALNIDDKLRQIPGFSLFRRSSSRTANPTTQGVSLRGLGASGASRALVLEDGIPLNDPFGAWVYWDRLPPESIASVEVVQEGASSLYGSDALGGVVQFITRSPSQSGISLETSYGNQNSPDFSLWAGGTKGPWEAALAGDVFHTDGYILTPESERGAVDTKAGVSDGTADLLIGRKIGTSGEVFARGWFLQEQRDNGTPLQTNRTILGQGALGANLQLGAVGSLTLRFYGEAQTYHQNFSAVASNRDSETLTDIQTVPSQGVGGSALWSRQAGKRQTLVAGFDLHEVIGGSNEELFSMSLPSAYQDAGGRQRDAGVFGEDLIEVTSKFMVTASARFDDWRNFDSETVRTPLAPPGPPVITPYADRSENAFDPRLGLLYSLNSHVKFSASAYRAFRAPTLNELYRQFRQGNTLTQSNAALRAERLTGAEAAVAVNGWRDRLQLRGTFFFNEIVDPIFNVTCSEPPNPPPCTPLSTSTLIVRQRQNLGRTQAPGFEVDADWKAFPRFDLSGGYQFVAATVLSAPANPGLVGLWVAQVPRNVLTFQARYSNPSRISFTVSGRMVGKQFDDDQNQYPLGGFFVLGAMASREIGRGISVFGAAENLLNEKYATAATPITQLGLPITARFGFRYDWPRR